MSAASRYADFHFHGPKKNKLVTNRAEWAGIEVKKDDNDPRDKDTLIKTLIDLKQRCIRAETENKEQRKALEADAVQMTRAGVAGKCVGLDSYLILRQSDAALEQQDDPGLCGNLLINRLVGAKLRMVSKTEYVKHGQYKLVDTLAGQLRDEGRAPYKIAVGGSTVVGVWGYLQFVEELRLQLASGARAVSDIVVACGSGGSTAGIAIGLKLAGLDIRLHGVLVCDNKDYFRKHIQDTIDALGLPYKADDLVVLHDEYKGKAYALSTDEELEVLRGVAASSAILADPVYTGKAICGMAGIAKGSALKGSEVLFVHTGGFFGLYDKEDQLANLLPKDSVARLFPKL